jgi:catechol-2,3-dioxygenase
LPDGSKVRPIQLAHLVLWTNQLPALKDWYCSVLGAHVVHENEKLAFLTYDSEHHRIALSSVNQDLAPRPAGRSVGLSHMAFTCANLGDLFAKYRHLKDKGVMPWWTIHHGPTVSMYYEDPDRNNVELQVDAFADAQAAVEWMKGEAFRKNPLGVVFEPEALIQRYLSGEPEEALLRRPEE